MGGGLGGSKNSVFFGWPFIISIFGAKANRCVLRQKSFRWVKSMSKVSDGAILGPILKIFFCMFSSAIFMPKKCQNQKSA